jgi:hypothetical protein
VTRRVIRATQYTWVPSSSFSRDQHGSNTAAAKRRRHSGDRVRGPDPDAMNSTKREGRKRSRRTGALLRCSLPTACPSSGGCAFAPYTTAARGKTHVRVVCIRCNVLVRRVEYLAPDAPGPSVAASSLGPGPAALKHGALGTDGRTKATTTTYDVRTAMVVARLLLLVDAYAVACARAARVYAPQIRSRSPHLTSCHAMAGLLACRLASWVPSLI